MSLDFLSCTDNRLRFLKLRGHSSFIPEFLNAQSNDPNLCIQVPININPEEKPFWYKDASAIYSTDCNANSTLINTKILQSNLNAENASAEIKVFPNPSTGIFNITNSEIIRSLEIFDVSGNALKDDKIIIIEPNKKIDLSVFASGIYFLRIFTVTNKEHFIKLYKK